MKIKIWNTRQREKLLCFFWDWMSAWVGLATGLVTLATFGLFCPLWYTNLLSWRIYTGRCER